MWAELKLTNTGDVAIPLVKICLPGEKKKAGWKKGMSFQVFTFPTLLFLLLRVVG